MSLLELNTYIDQMSRYRDRYDLVVQEDRDGGDTANRIGSYYTYLAYADASRDDNDTDPVRGFVSAAYLLEKFPGRFVRHPDPNKWYSNHNNFTRDQSIMLQSAFVMFKDNAQVANKAKRMLEERKKRWLFHFNDEAGDDRPETKVKKLPDPPSPIEVSQFIRALDSKGWWTWALYLADIQLVFDVYVLRPISNSRGVKDFDINYFPILLSSLRTKPTFWAKLAARKYASLEDVPDKIDAYYKEGPGHNGLMPLARIARWCFNKLKKEYK